MSTRDARGHVVPSGDDPARRQALLDLSLSIPSIHAVKSSAEAVQHVQALAAAGVAATPESPVYVFRTDLATIFWWDGARWASSIQVQLQAMGGWSWGVNGGRTTIAGSHVTVEINVKRSAGTFWKTPGQRVDFIVLPDWLPLPKGNLGQVGFLAGWGMQPMSLEIRDRKIWFVPDVNTTINQDWLLRGMATWGF